MEITKTEIDLCKQIAERYRKEIGLGDWFLSPETGDVEFLCQYGYGERNVFIPLWTISDCLEFFGDKFRAFGLTVSGEFEVRLKRKDGSYYKFGKTPLEACLKGVLAVLEEKE